jgi:hypothetical protein
MSFFTPLDFRDSTTEYGTGHLLLAIPIDHEPSAIIIIIKNCIFNLDYSIVSVLKIHYIITLFTVYNEFFILFSATLYTMYVSVIYRLGGSRKIHRHCWTKNFLMSHLFDCGISISFRIDFITRYIDTISNYIYVSTIYTNV